MRVTVSPCVPRGEVRIPTSKSMAHRYLIAAAFTSGETVIRGLPDNCDVRATLGCLRCLGVDIEQCGETTVLHGMATTASLPGAAVLDCGESGTTLRLLLPFALLGDRPITFCGAGRLMERPMSVYEDICRDAGLMWRRGEGSITVCGPLEGGDFAVPGNISSQFISGLLLALPHAAGDSRITLTTALESASYVELTLRALRELGYSVERPQTGTFIIPGGQCGRANSTLNVPTDQSAAAFFGALRLLGGGISMPCADDDGLQGDRVWRDYFESIKRGHCTLSIADCPDLGPVLMAAGALCDGVTLRDTARLRFKESDRGAAMAEELAKFGVRVEVGENELHVGRGVRTPREPLCSYNDHRIAMSLAVVVCAVGGTVEGAECVAKSLPEFWDMLRALGADVQRED